MVFIWTLNYLHSRIDVHMNLYLPTQQYWGSYELLFTDTVELVFIWTPINRHSSIGVHIYQDSSFLSPFMTYHCICIQINTICHLRSKALLTLLKHLSSTPVFRGVRVTQTLVFCLVLSIFVEECFNRRLVLHVWYRSCSVAEQFSIPWLSASHLSKWAWSKCYYWYSKVCFFPWPSPWNRQRRTIENKSIRQTFPKVNYPFISGNIPVSPA